MKCKNCGKCTCCDKEQNSHISSYLTNPRMIEEPEGLGIRSLFPKPPIKNKEGIAIESGCLILFLPFFVFLAL